MGIIFKKVSAWLLICALLITSLAFTPIEVKASGSVSAGYSITAGDILNITQDEVFGGNRTFWNDWTTGKAGAVNQIKMYDSSVLSNVTNGTVLGSVYMSNSGSSWSTAAEFAAGQLSALALTGTHNLYLKVSAATSTSAGNLTAMSITSGTSSTKTTIYPQNCGWGISLGTNSNASIETNTMWNFKDGYILYLGQRDITQLSNFSATMKAKGVSCRVDLVADYDLNNFGLFPIENFNVSSMPTSASISNGSFIWNTAGVTPGTYTLHFTSTINGQQFTKDVTVAIAAMPAADYSYQVQAGNSVSISADDMFGEDVAHRTTTVLDYTYYQWGVSGGTNNTSASMSDGILYNCKSGYILYLGKRDITNLTDFSIFLKAKSVSFNAKLIADYTVSDISNWSLATFTTQTKFYDSSALANITGGQELGTISLASAGTSFTTIQEFSGECQTSLTGEHDLYLYVSASSGNAGNLTGISYTTTVKDTILDFTVKSDTKPINAEFVNGVFNWDTADGEAGNYRVVFTANLYGVTQTKNVDIVIYDPSNYTVQFKVGDIAKIAVSDMFTGSVSDVVYSYTGSSLGAATVSNSVYKWDTTGKVSGDYTVRFTAVNDKGKTIARNAVITLKERGNYTHPGLLFNQDALDNIYTKYQMGEEPWKSAGDEIIASAKKNYSATGLADILANNNAITCDDGDFNNWFREDCHVIYQNTLAYVLTKDEAYAETAIALINAYSSKMPAIKGKNAQLVVAQQAFRLCNAAEILRYTYSKWDKEDIGQLEQWMLRVYMPILNTYGQANWGTGCLKGMLAIGIFCGDSEVYDSAINAFKTNSDCGITSVTNSAGQNRESGRDQIHAQLLIGHLAEFAWAVYNQNPQLGAELFAMGDNRILKAYEYTAAYMLGNDVPYDNTFYSTNYTYSSKISSSNRGELLPIYEIVYNYYVNILGLNAPYTTQAAEFTRNEGISAFNAHYDTYHMIGYGTLMTAVEECPAIPQNLQSEALSGIEINLNWGAAANATGYNIYRSTSAVTDSSMNYPDALYAKVNTAPITEISYKDSGLVPGNKYFYKVSAVNNSGNESGTTEPTYIQTMEVAPKAAPVMVTASSVSDDITEVAWSAVDDATSYDIYTSTDDITYVKVNSTSITGAHGYHVGLKPDTTYHYKVKAVNAYGESELSQTSASMATSTNAAGSSKEDVVSYPRTIKLQAAADLSISSTGTVDAANSICTADISNCSYIKYDLSGNPIYTGETVQASKLYITRGGSYNTFNLDFIESQSTDYDDWSETLAGDGYTASSSNLGSLLYTMPSDSITSIATSIQKVNSGLAYADANGDGIDITACTSQEYQGDKMMTFRLTSDGMGFYSINSTTANYRPYTLITITNPVVEAYEAEKAIEYTVTFDKNQGDTEASPVTKTAMKNGTVTLPQAPARAGYTFNGWNTAADGSGSEFTEATPVTNNITVYAQWKKTTTSGGSTWSSNFNTEKEVVYTSNTATSDAPAFVKGTIATSITKNENGKVTVQVNESQLQDAIGKVTKDAQNADGSVAIVDMDVSVPSGTQIVEANIPADIIKTAVEKNLQYLSVTSSLAKVTFNSKTLNTILKASDSDIVLKTSIADKAALSGNDKDKIGDRPVYEFSVYSKEKQISNFDGDITVAVPYQLKADEDFNSLLVYYINSDGKLEAVKNGHYDSSTGMFIFKTNHFSEYAVGYNQVIFKDIPVNASYKDALSYLAAREITSGTGNGCFSPNDRLTRGQLITMVMRAYNILPDSNISDNFSDAGDTYYTGYLAAAKRLGLSLGVGNNSFEPEKEITRQDMLTLIYNVLKIEDKLPYDSLRQSISKYSDIEKVAPWAKNATTLFVNTGVLESDASLILPEDPAERAFLAQILYNLLKK